MKKILTAFAMALLLAGCAKQYDDSAIKTRLSAVETKLIELEGNIQSLQSAVGEGVFVAKVQEYADPETGKTVGVTITYTNGDVKYFEISPKADYAGPVLGVIQSGSGALVWAVDGIAIEVGGKEVPVYQTPVFSIDEDGNLWVEVDGEKVNLGQVQNEGATLVDGIFTDIKVEADKVVLTLSDGTKVNIPFAEPFKLNIEINDVVFEKRFDAITIPYTVSGKTEGTVVGVTGYNPNDFKVEVTESAIVITPYQNKAAAVMTAYADSKIGLVSLVELTVNHEEARVTNPNADSIVTDFIVDAEGGSLVVNVVSNVEIEAVPDEDSGWITVVETKAMKEHTITLSIAANSEAELREGCVDIYKKGTDKMIYNLFIDQEGVVAGPKDLGKKETANCYIVTAADEYKFAAVKGNSAESVGTVKEAVVLWETVNTDTAPEANSIIASVAFADGYVTFSTPTTLEPGNAVIAAKDADGVILWSWHIWIPETAIATNTYGIAERPIMDRYLGALTEATQWETSGAADGLSFGLLYQWGRKDPFPNVYDAGSRKAAKVAGTQFAYGTTKMSMAEAIANPTQVNALKDDWNTETNNDLWGGESGKKTINDPCPPGYCVPTAADIATIIDNKPDELATWACGASVSGTGFTWFQLGTPATVFPNCGFYNYDASYSRAYRSVLWTATKSDDAQAKCKYIYEGPGFASSARKSQGGSIRCIAVVAE